MYGEILSERRLKDIRNFQQCNSPPEFLPSVVDTKTVSKAFKVKLFRVKSVTNGTTMSKLNPWSN